MGGIRIRVNKGRPCKICGATDWDMIMRYDNDGEEQDVHWCHKTHVPKGDVISIQGESYLCIATDKQIDTGYFSLYVKYIPKEEYLLRMKNKPREVFVREVEKRPEILPGETKPRSNEELHEIYSYFLEQLILEQKHYQSMKEEWESGIFKGITSSLVKEWNLKSLPPLDQTRFGKGQNKDLKNPTRRAVIRKLVKKFGPLTGVPGFYEKTGEYYSAKEESERWVISGKEGILFPCYDVNGYIYCLRYKDDYPDYKVDNFLGQEGTLSMKYSKDWIRQWWFTPAQGTAILITGTEHEYLLQLNSRGLPTIGRSSGKYKTISSVYEKLVNGITVNKMYNGSRPGSPYSLYAHNVTNWKVAIVTEGEKKGIIANYVKKVPVAHVSGVGTFRSLFKKNEDGFSAIDFLKSKGCKYLIICYDADKYTKEQVEKAEQGLIKATQEEDLIPLVGEWNGKFDKGLDDILLMGLDFVIKKV